MAGTNNKNGNEKINYATKADVILQRQAEIAAKIDSLLSGGAGTAGSDALIEKIIKENSYVSRQNSVIYEKLVQENEKLRKELNYVAAQCENVYVKLSGMITALRESCAIDYDKLARVLEERAASGAVYAGLSDEVAPAAAASVVSDDAEQLTISEQYINYDELAERMSDKLVQKMPAAAVAETNVDYDELARKVAACIPPQEVISPDYVASKVAEQIVIPQVILGENGQAQPVEVRATAQVDYDELAQRIAEKLAPAESADESVALAAAEETVPADMDTDALSDEIARKVAALSPNDFDIIVDDEGCRSLAEAMVETLDYDKIAQKLAERYALGEIAVADASVQESESINSDDLAALVSEKLAANGLNEDAIADKTAAAISNVMPEIDTDDIADKVVAALLPAMPAAREVDYDTIVNGVYEKLAETQADNDYDIIIDEEGLQKLTDSISWKVSASTNAVMESVEDKVAKVKSDTEYIRGELADKVSEDETVAEAEEPAAAVSAAAVGDEGIKTELEEIKAKIDELAQNFSDLFAPDEEETYEEEASEEADDNVKAELEEIKTKLDEIKNDGALEDLRGKVDELGAKIDSIFEPDEEETYEEEVSGEEFETEDDGLEEIKNEIADINKQLDEIKAMLMGGAAVVAATQTAGEETAEEQETRSEETLEEPEEEAAGEEELVTVSDIVDESDTIDEQIVDEAMENIIEEVEEQTAEGEAQPDGIPGISNGVDFANMMKYNRSFIARIIQSSDEVKRYYGQIKNAMLAYKKVNSSIAWGAERFNKGRETIAKLKIRGKTLCLYLNLDPNEYKTSVYHQVDVSDNKSMHGTPMMVKIKSPLGVRKAIRLIDDMLAKRNGEKRVIQERDYAAMYPYETIEELIEDGLVKDVSKNK